MTKDNCSDGDGNESGREESLQDQQCSDSDRNESSDKGDKE